MFSAKSSVSKLLLSALFLLGQFGFISASRPANASQQNEERTRRNLWRSAALYASYIVPLGALERSLANKDKRFYMLAETPLMGLVTDPIGMFISTQFTGQPFSIGDTAQNYLSYQGSQVIRNGVTLDERLTPAMKVVINWWITTLAYSTFNGVPLLVKAVEANDPKAMTFALSTVAFAGAWAALTQIINTGFITPMLFGRFPPSSLLKKIYDTENFTREELIREKEIEIAAIEKRAIGRNLNFHERRSIKYLKKHIEFINWFRDKKTADGKENPRGRKQLYWLKKAARTFLIASIMISAYHSTRFAVRGPDTSPEHRGPLTELMEPAGKPVLDFMRNAVTTLNDVAITEDKAKVSESEVLDFSDAVIENVVDNQKPFPALSLDEAHSIFAPELLLSPTNKIFKLQLEESIPQRTSCRLLLSY